MLMQMQAKGMPFFVRRRNRAPQSHRPVLFNGLRNQNGEGKESI